MKMRRYRVACFFGTRPEIIKMAPVLQALRRHRSIETLACDTGQHREMAKPLLKWFGIHPDHSLRLMSHDQSLSGFAARALRAVDQLLAQTVPDLVVCQGDTSTAMIVALAAFHRRIAVAHIEAGLRSGNLQAPWPEEMNRRIIDMSADLLFSPTRRAARNLFQEGVSPNKVSVTGNTAIDALFWTLERISGESIRFPGSSLQLQSIARRLDGHASLGIITAHRRESFGEGMRNIAQAIRGLAKRHPEIEWIFPIHLNPNVRTVMVKHLFGIDNLHLIEPLGYPQFCHLLARARLVLTDSGGLQEECPSLGTPVFVMRTVTERPEGVESGNTHLVGVQTQQIVDGVSSVLRNKAVYARMARKRNPYGRGDAGLKIARVIDRFFRKNRIFA